MMTADGCDGLPNEAEACLSRAFRRDKHRASLKAEWQDDEHTGDGLPGIVCQSKALRPYPLLPPRRPRPLPPHPRTPSPSPPTMSKPPSPSLVLSVLRANEMHVKTRVHTHAVASERTHKATSWCKAPSHDPFSTCLPGAFFFLKCLPGGSDCKESKCNEGDLGSIPGLERSPGGGPGNPLLQYSCLENPHGQRSQAGYSPCSRRARHDWAAKHSTAFSLNRCLRPCPH